MKRRLAAALFCLIAATPALACSCAPRKADAPGPDVLVTAEVTNVADGTTRGSHIATLRVLERHAGEAPRTIRVETRSSPAACGVAFTKGERRKFALYRWQGRFTTNACYMFHHARP